MSFVHACNEVFSCDWPLHKNLQEYLQKLIEFNTEFHTLYIFFNFKSKMNYLLLSNTHYKILQFNVFAERLPFLTMYLCFLRREGLESD